MGSVTVVCLVATSPLAASKAVPFRCGNNRDRSTRTLHEITPHVNPADFESVPRHLPRELTHTNILTRDMKSCAFHQYLLYGQRGATKLVKGFSSPHLI